MTKSTLLCDTPNYKAFVLRDTLIVENKQTKKQVALVGAQVGFFANEIKTSIDNSEANALCKAVYNA